MLPDRSNTTMTSRVAGGGGAGTVAAMIVFVGNHNRSLHWKLQQGSPFERTPRILPAMSNRPDPELPPETWSPLGTVTPVALLALTVENPSATGGGRFFTGPLGWWAQKNFSPLPRKACRTWANGMPPTGSLRPRGVKTPPLSWWGAMT